MEATRLAKLLSAYLDGELSGSLRRAVDDRLARSPRAARMLEELRQTRAALQGLAAVRLQEDESAAVWAAVRAEAAAPMSATAMAAASPARWPLADGPDVAALLRGLPRVEAPPQALPQALAALSQNRPAAVGDDAEAAAPRMSFRELVSAYLDEEVSPRRRRVVESKLRRHPRGRAWLQDLEAGRSALESLPREAAPPQLLPQVLAEIRGTEMPSVARAKAAGSGAWRTVAAWASLAAAVAGVGYLGHAAANRFVVGPGEFAATVPALPPRQAPAPELAATANAPKQTPPLRPDPQPAPAVAVAPAVPAADPTEPMPTLPKARPDVLSDLNQLCQYSAEELLFLQEHPVTLRCGRVGDAADRLRLLAVTEGTKLPAETAAADGKGMEIVLEGQAGVVAKLLGKLRDLERQQPLLAGVSWNRDLMRVPQLPPSVGLANIAGDAPTGPAVPTAKGSSPKPAPPLPAEQRRLTLKVRLLPAE